jgi:ABC-type multidrug transport system ATPase subunit
MGVSFGSNEVLKTASFSAWPGRITVLIGRNGVGKTTLLKAAIGRVRSDWGRVLFKGEFIRRPTLARLARDGLMYCSQDSALTPLFSIRDHIDAFVRVYPDGGGIDDVVATMKLAPLLELRPRDLSGGERQRVSLALALLRRPDCLLMDEPFAGVAPIDRPLIAAGLSSLRRQGVAIVISGHDVDDLFATSDEVIWVVAGTTHWLGTPAAAAVHHEFRRSYLGPRAPTLASNG